MKSKGIMRMIEVVIASIILLAALSFFISPRIEANDWQTAATQAAAQDALAALDSSGSLDKYVAERESGGGYRLYNDLSSMLPPQTDFTMNVTFSDSRSYDMCCDFGEPCCKEVGSNIPYVRVSYLSDNYQIALKIWRVFY